MKKLMMVLMATTVVLGASSKANALIGQVYLGGTLGQPVQYNNYLTTQGVQSIYAFINLGGAALVPLTNWFWAGLDYRLLLSTMSGASGSPNASEEFEIGRLAGAIEFVARSEKKYFGLKGAYGFYHHGNIVVKQNATTTTYLQSLTFSPSYNVDLDFGWLVPMTSSLWFSFEMGFQEFMVRSTTLSSGGVGPAVTLNGPTMQVKLTWGL